MNKKSWLIVGLSLAMAASIGVGISACGGETHTHSYTKWQYDANQHWKVCPADDAMDPAGKSAHDFTNGDCECGAKKPEHTHTYDAWDYNETQHWKYCDEHGSDKTNIDETTKADHTIENDACKQCGYQFEMYVVGNITSLGSVMPSGYASLGQDKYTEIPKSCPKMTLSEDGKTYTAEVYLVPADYFGVYNLKTNRGYPSVVASCRKPVEGVLRVEEANTYLISWKIGEAKPTVRVHDHKYTKWQYDADQHWKVCPTDGAVDPTPKASHSYDPETHECECGAVETVSCEHSNGYAFNYSELPAVEADGGTLQKVCPDCGDTQDVTYVKGIPHIGATCSRSAKQTEVTEDGNYYLTGQTAFKFHISKAGTYTVRFEGGILKDQSIVRLYMLAFNKGSYLTSVGSATGAICGTNASKYDEQIAAYGVTIDGYESGVTSTPFKSLSIVIEEDDLSEGDVYVQIGFTNNNALGAVSATNLGYLISVSGFAAAPAAASVAPVEVAMLPEKKD